MNLTLSHVHKKAGDTEVFQPLFTRFLSLWRARVGLNPRLDYPY